MPNKSTRGPNGRFLPKPITPIALPMVIRKPFSNPTPLQDQIARRFGPVSPIPARQQVPGRTKGNY
jgi:hypothetical protein